MDTSLKSSDAKSQVMLNCVTGISDIMNVWHSAREVFKVQMNFSVRNYFKLPVYIINYYNL